MAQADFPVRWKEAEELHRLPDLLTATHWAGAVRGLDHEGRLQAVVSERLSSLPQERLLPGLCRQVPLAGPGFRTSREPREGGRAGTEAWPPAAVSRVPALVPRPQRLQAEHTARRAGTAFLSGDAAGRNTVASRRSSQLAECTHPGPSNKVMKALAREVELRGNDLLAVAIVETSYENDRFVRRDPVVVVLVEEDKHWRVLCVCRDIMTLTDALPAICKVIVQREPPKSAAPELRMLSSGMARV